MRQTSPHVSTLASSLVGFSPDQFLAIADGKPGAPTIGTFASHVRTVAASALGQDETAGQAPPNFYDRLIAEREELVGRLAKLNSFLDRGGLPRKKFEDAHQQDLLEAQAAVMQAYLTILDKRIAITPAPVEHAEFNFANQDAPSEPGECPHEKIYAAEGAPTGECIRCRRKGIPVKMYGQSALNQPGFLTKLPPAQPDGEPVETGGHDQDRDGPPKFSD